MKNKVIIILILVAFSSITLAENLSIQSKNITLDKKKGTSVFENEVIVKTLDGNVIKSDFAEYDKTSSLIKFKKNVIATDVNNNIIQTEYAEYNEKTEIFKSLGPTEILTSKKYKIKGADIIFNEKKNIINSKQSSTISDQDNNIIYLDNFEYIINENVFKSVGLIKIEDSKKNSYEFSQLYIDTKKKEILGTDIKAFLNQKEFKINDKNKPRIFANTISLQDEVRSFGKSIFTLCDYRKNDKCPPWTIQAGNMLHDNKKKTIYYDNAVIKVYNVPIFYFPRLSHPDPSVERRSGLLPPSISDSKNLGLGISIPYFFAINKDKNFTLTSRFYAAENPLFLGEYHQAFKNSNFLADFGFTDGYKNTSASKKAGEKSHFFSKFIKNFKGKDKSENSVSLSLQEVSNDKYLKLYKIKSNLVDYNSDTLKSSFSFIHEKDDLFFGLNTSVFETLKESYNDKYEYILPEVTLDKNLFNSEIYGNLDLQSNLKVHNYDTNKLENFLINDFNWSSKKINSEFGLVSKFLGNFKNINYEAKNVDLYKKDPTSEIYSSLGYLAELDFQKSRGDSKHFFTPKMLIRYAPGSMRKEDSGSKLDPYKAYRLDRLDNINNFETGLTATLGFDYKIKNTNHDFDFSVAQIISEEENKKMSSQSSLDEKLSDLVGFSSLKLNKNVTLNHEFALDQNYQDINYNELGAKINLNSIDVDFNYLQEKKHIGDQEYFKTKLNYNNNDSGVFSFETKRNLVTNSAEYYNLSYEYTNDCLRAGLVYRREFYNDSELEPENSLMFKITISPFGTINTPKLSR